MTAQRYPDLFEAGTDWQMNSCLNFKYDMSNGYIDGYRRGADILVEHVAETACDQDVLIYPIAFMYRQHVELQLKMIIDTGRKLLTADQGFPSHHKLHALWSLAKGILRQTWPDVRDPEEFKIIDHFIDQFSRVDCDSTAFRYPSQKTGDRSLHGIRHINIRNLAECINSFSGFLDGAATALLVYLDHKFECEYDPGH